jgi:hypothetical protein
VVASIFVKKIPSSCMEGLDSSLCPLVIFLWIPFLFSVIFTAFLVDFRGKVLEEFLCGICVGNHT